jgi:hypothetical protein
MVGSVIWNQNQFQAVPTFTLQNNFSFDMQNWWTARSAHTWRSRSRLLYNTRGSTSYGIVYINDCSFSSELNDFVDRESFNVYISLQQHLQNFENSCKNLQKDDRLKKFRFECQVSIIALTVIFIMSYFLRS